MKKPTHFGRPTKEKVYNTVEDEAQYRRQDLSEIIKQAQDKYRDPSEHDPVEYEPFEWSWRKEPVAMGLSSIAIVVSLIGIYLLLWH